MNKSLRKILPAIALLLISAITLSTASYAWFTSNKQVSASGMNVSAVTPANIEISTNGGTFGTSAAATPVTGRIYAVSTTTGFSNFFTADGDSNGDAQTETITAIQSPVAASTTNGHYVDTVFTIRNTGDYAVNLYLQEVTITGGTNLRNALKVAFLNAAGTDALDTRYIYEVNHDSKGNGPLVDADGTSAAFDTNSLLTPSEASYNDAAKIYSLAAQSSGTAATVTLTVRIWLEGQSTSCITTYMNETMSIALRFGAEVVTA